MTSRTALAIGRSTLCAVLAFGMIGMRAAQLPSKLLIWPKLPNSATGATIDIAIDGTSRGTISNINQQEMLDIGDLAEGPHTFTLTNMVVYLVDSTGKATKAPISGSGTCSGQFRATPFQTYYFIGVRTPDGKSFECGIQ